MNTHIHTYTYIYMYTRVLLCIYMHRACGTISKVDHSAMLSWCKVCITKNIHEFYHKFYLKAIANANDTIPCAICWSHAYAAGNVLLVCWLAGLLASRLAMMLLAGPTGAAGAGTTGAVGSGGGGNNDAMWLRHARCGRDRAPLRGLRDL